MGRVINRLMNRVIDRTSRCMLGGPVDMRVISTAEGDIVTLRDSVNGTLNEIYIYGKSVQNGTPTPDSPVAIESFENAEVRSHTGNLIDDSIWIGRVVSTNYHIYLVSPSGQKLPPVGTTIYCAPFIDGELYINSDISNVFVPYARLKNGSTKYIGINIPRVVEDDWLYIYASNGAIPEKYFGKTITGYMVSTKPITAYEPYKEPSVLPIPYTLRGLKVASGGNYTDSDGQQWVSDYLHLWRENGVVKGEMVEAVYSLDVANTPHVVINQKDYTDYRFDSIPIVRDGTRDSKPLMCNKINSFGNADSSVIQKIWAYNSGNVTRLRFNPVGDNGKWHYGTQEELDELVNGMFLDFVREESSTTAIPTDQATAMLNALKTYKPTTNVIGSKPCGLSVQYKAQAPGEVELYGSSPLVLPYVGGSALKSLYLTGGEITQDGVPTPDSPKPIKIGGKELRVNDAGVAYVDGQEVVVSGGNMFKNRNLIGGPVTILSNDANGLRVRAIASDFYIGTINYSLGQYAVYASSLIPLNGAHKLYFYSGNDLLIKNFYSLYDADKKSIAINDRGLAFGQIYDANGIIDITNPNAEYIAFRLGNGSVNIGDEFIIRPYVGLAPMGEKFVPYVEPISIPIPLLIGSDTAEITGNNPVSKGVNLWDEEWELGQYSDSGVPFDNNKRIRSKNPIPCKPNTVYVCSIAEAQRLQFFDKNMNHIGNAYADSPMIELKSPSNACYMQFFAWESYGATYKHDICISESNPFTNGLYFPYEAEPQKKGVKVARWGVKVLDGSEFVQLATTKNKHVFHIALEKKINADSQTVVCAYSNMYSATYQGYIFNIEPDMSIASWTWGSGVGITHFAITSVNAFKEYVRNKYNQGDPIVVVYMIHVEQKSILPVTAPLIKPTSVLTSYVSKMDVTYKAKKAEWWKYLVGIDHDIDLTDKNVTLEALVSIISNSNPKSAIVIALPSDAYKKCVSGGGWNGTISAELAKKPLVTLALK